MSDDTPLYEHLDSTFPKLVSGAAKLETLCDDCRWAEGPVWFGDGGYLLWSDIPNDRILRWIPGLGVDVFRTPAGNTNGHTRDREGRLISCSHGHRRVERTEHDGSITVLADSFEGKRLNSPNDVVVKSDGTIWFTDPAYGIDSDYEGHKSPMEQAGCFVYCLDPKSGKLKAVVTDMDRPNGLAFSPDESILYIADSAASFTPDRPHHLRAFKVGANNRLTGGKVFVDVNPGIPDGLRIDTDGNIWCTAKQSVLIYSPAGGLIARINVPKTPANITFGGPKNNWLFIAATDSVHLLHTMANGARRPG
ncbi:MAG TPA: SMP-30/gluconolactonase/LRE family protein [Devosia sp.]|nr:SMP-30/gluconolactonase/LRE family protein [Devosia sp.]